MSSTYRPRVIDYIKKNIDKVIQVVGPTGSGKTYSIYKACEELKFDCITFDEEYHDIQVRNLEGRIQVVHLDHPSYWADINVNTLKNRGYVIIEEDKPVYPVTTLYVDVPPLQYFMKMGVKSRNWWKVVVGGDDFDVETQKERIITAVNTSNFSKLQSDDFLILWDTGVRNYYGVNLLRFIQLYEVVDYFSNFSVLNGIKPLKNITEVSTDLIFKLSKKNKV